MDTLTKFLVYTTASDLMPPQTKVYVEFNSTEGEQRLPRATTCTNTLTVSRLYVSQEDLSLCLTNVLSSEQPFSARWVLTLLELSIHVENECSEERTLVKHCQSHLCPTVLSKEHPFFSYRVLNCQTSVWVKRMLYCYCSHLCPIVLLEEHPFYSHLFGHHLWVTNAFCYIDNLLHWEVYDIEEVAIEASG